jgi:hypothetical protein
MPAGPPPAIAQRVVMVSVVMPSLHFFRHVREGGHPVTADFGNNAPRGYWIAGQARHNCEDRRITCYRLASAMTFR